MIAHSFRLFRAPRLLGNESGMALVEFALSLPLVIALGIGGFELAHFALTNMRVNQIALSVADNAGRVLNGIDEADVTEVFAGARITGDPIDFEQKGRVVLSSLQHNGLENEDEGQMVNWQRCWGELDAAPLYAVENDGRTDGSLQGMGPPAQQIASVRGTAVMFVEVTYNYEPMIGGVLSPRRIRYESAFIVRNRTNNDITNIGSIPESTCS